MPDELFSVEGQVVLVSGGSRGIGRAIARGFADRGATVIITGRDQATLRRTADEIQPAGETAPAVHGEVCDLADPRAIERLVPAILDRHEHIDTLVNVAGVNRRMPAEELSEDDYDFVMNINCKGAFLFSMAVGRHMLDRGRGNQINIGSLNNLRPLVNVAPYAMSKAALGHMTRALAGEWGGRGVRVNAIAPGFILTDLTEKLWSDPAMHEWGVTNTPQRRLGQPEDMVGTAIFLASKAAAFLTGQIIYVDGGFTSSIRWPIPG